MSVRSFCTRYRWSVLAVCVLLLGTCSFGREPAFECFAVTDLVRVFEDGYRCPPLQDHIGVFGIRNEYVSAQCVVRAREEIKDLTVSISLLKHADGNVMLAPACVTWNFVASIPITENTPKSSSRS